MGELGLGLGLGLGTARGEDKQEKRKITELREKCLDQKTRVGDRVTKNHS
jgi:hypothetical protein